MCRFNIFKKKKKEEPPHITMEKIQSISKILCAYLEKRNPRIFLGAQNAYSLQYTYEILLKHLQNIREIDEESKNEIKNLFRTTIHNLEINNYFLFPDRYKNSNKYENIDHSWDNVDWSDMIDILNEAEKYADPSTVDNMTLEETLKLIEEHNPSFAKAMREELEAEKEMREYPQY